jgi:hypothetical protein
LEINVILPSESRKESDCSYDQKQNKHQNLNYDVPDNEPGWYDLLRGMNGLCERIGDQRRDKIVNNKHLGKNK